MNDKLGVVFGGVRWGLFLFVGLGFFFFCRFVSLLKCIPTFPRYKLNLVCVHLHAHSAPIICLHLENVKIPPNLGLFGDGKEEPWF